MAKITKNALTGFLLLLLATYGLISRGAQAATLLPYGQTCLYDADGNPLSAGTINFDIPSTTTPKDTWNSTTQSGGTLNDNPVELDASGCAIIYGSGSYREIVKDVGGNTIFDGLTASTPTGGVIWGGTATGTANAQVIVAGDFNATDGQVVAFLASNTNTTAATVQTANVAATPVVKDIASGPTALTGGEIVANNVVMMVYTTAGGRFHLIENPVGGGAGGGIAWGGTSGGTANAQTVTASGFVDEAGAMVAFIVGTTNTAAATLAVNGGTAYALRKQNLNGVTALTGGELVSGNIVILAKTGSTYQLLTPTFASNTVFFTSSSTWTKPTNISTSAFTNIECWGAGGGGDNGGGGGGGYSTRIVATSQLGSTETVTIPAGGAVGVAGGNATFGSWVTAYGGGHSGSGANDGGGGGGGQTSVGGNAPGAGGAGSGGDSGGPLNVLGGTTAVGENGVTGAGGGGDGGVGVGFAGGRSYFGGGGGGGAGDNTHASGAGGATVYGGGGGGGRDFGGGGGAAGSSKFGGAGGAGGSAGSAPGGGGGGVAAGGRGECRVWTSP